MEQCQLRLRERLGQPAGDAVQRRIFYEIETVLVPETLHGLVVELLTQIPIVPGLPVQGRKEPAKLLRHRRIDASPLQLGFQGRAPSQVRHDQDAVRVVEVQDGRNGPLGEQPVQNPEGARLVDDPVGGDFEVREEPQRVQGLFHHDRSVVGGDPQHGIQKPAAQFFHRAGTFPRRGQ